jgi:hypothetical protein
MDILKKRSRKEYCAKRALFQRALNDLLVVSCVLCDSSAEITKTFLSRNEVQKKNRVFQMRIGEAHIWLLVSRTVAHLAARKAGESLLAPAIMNREHPPQAFRTI